MRLSLLISSSAVLVGGCELFIGTFTGAPDGGALDAAPDASDAGSECGTTSSLDLCGTNGGFPCLLQNNTANFQCVSSAQECVVMNGGVVGCAAETVPTSAMSCGTQPCCIPNTNPTISGSCPTQVSLLLGGANYVVTECADAGSCPSGVTVCTTNADCASSNAHVCVPARFAIGGKPTLVNLGICM